MIKQGQIEKYDTLKIKFGRVKIIPKLSKMMFIWPHMINSSWARVFCKFLRTSSVDWFLYDNGLRHETVD